MIPDDHHGWDALAQLVADDLADAVLLPTNHPDVRRDAGHHPLRVRMIHGYRSEGMKLADIGDLMSMTDAAVSLILSRYPDPCCP